MFPAVHGVVSQGGHGKQPSPDGPGILHSESISVLDDSTATFETPTGLQPGDVVMIFTTDSALNIGLEPMCLGFRRISDSDPYYGPASAIGSPTFVFARVVGSDEPEEYVVEWPTASRRSAGLIAIRGVDNQSPLRDSDRTAYTTSDATRVAPSVNGAAGDVLLTLATYVGPHTGSWSVVPAGMTSRVDVEQNDNQVGSTTMRVWSEVLSAAGATGTRTAQRSSGQQGIAWNGVTRAAASPPAAHPIEQVGTATSTGTTSAVSVAKPAGLQSGDLLVLLVATRGATTVTPPTGFTLADWARASDASATGHLRAFTKVAGGSEPETYDSTLGGNARHACIVLALRGAGGIEDTDAEYYTSASNSRDAPSLTPAGAGRYHLVVPLRASQTSASGGFKSPRLTEMLTRYVASSGNAASDVAIQAFGGQRFNEVATGVLAFPWTAVARAGLVWHAMIAPA